MCGFLFVVFLSWHNKPFFSPSVHQSVSWLASWSVSAQWPPIYAFWDSPSFLLLVVDTRLYTLPCRSVGKSHFWILSGFCITAPAQPSATGLPCIWPCYAIRLKDLRPDTWPISSRWWVGRGRGNKAEIRPELPRGTLSHSESHKSYQESCRAVKNRPELLRGTPEQSGDGLTDGRTNRPTDRGTDIPTYRDARMHLKIRVGRGCFLVGQGQLCSEITNSANFASSKILRYGPSYLPSDPLMESHAEK